MDEEIIELVPPINPTHADERRVETHADFIFNYFVNSYKEQKFTDVVVRCDSQLVGNAQRLVLAAFSTNFSIVLRDVKSVVVNLDIDSSVTNVTAEELLAVLDYMYSGKVQLSRPSMIATLKALGCYCIVPLLAHFEQNGASRKLIIEDADHANCFLIALEKFYIEEKFCDCTLKFQDKTTLKSHRMVLCAFSDAFENIFKNRWRSCEHLIINVNAICSFISSQDMQIILDFMYTGRVRAVHRRFRSLRDSARRIGVRRLVQVLSDAIDQQELYDNRDAETSEKFNYTVVEFQNEVELDSESLEIETTVNPKDDNFDYSVVYNTYINGPARGKKLFCRKPSSRFVSATEDNNDNAALYDINGTDSAASVSNAESQFYVGNQKEFMEKPFKCPYCDHRTKEKSAVEKHIRCIHTHEAPYHCTFCQQSFKVQSNLMRHIRIHTGEKPYVCKKCGSSYADKKNMDAHVYREHLGQSPFVCSKAGCNAKFWRKDRFENHLAKFHCNDAG